MQMKTVITLYVYLFLRLLIKNLSIALTVLFKSSKKLIFALSLKLNF